MKLYDVPRDTVVYIPAMGKDFFFCKIDGMYSICLDESNEVWYIQNCVDAHILEDQTWIN